MGNAFRFRRDGGADIPGIGDKIQLSIGIYGSTLVFGHQEADGRDGFDGAGDFGCKR